MSEQKQNNQSSGGFRTSIGGQALIEGIYMRGPDKQSIVVRDQNGELVVKTEELKLTKDMLNAHPGLTRIHITVEEA